MTYQFRLTRYLAYLGPSLLFFGFGALYFGTSLGRGPFLIVMTFGVAYYFYYRLLEFVAQKHFLKRIQPVLQGTDPKRALEMAETLLSVRANRPPSWHTFLIEIQSMGALLQNNRVAEAGRRFAWVENQYAALIKKDDYARFRMEGQRVLLHLAEHGGIGLAPLLEAYREALGKVRLEIQTSFQSQKDLFESAEAAFASADEVAWEDLKKRFLAHEKASTRRTCEMILDRKNRRESNPVDADPSVLEGDVLPIRRHPRGEKRIFEILASVLSMASGGFAVMVGLGLPIFAAPWIALILVVGFASAVFLTLRAKYHEGVSMLILLLAGLVSILVSMLVSIID